MHRPELTLAAAIRDSSSARGEARHKAVRNLAPALLAALDEAGPAWRAAARHPGGAEVRAALERAFADPNAHLAGVAAIGLGTIGEPEAIEALAGWLELRGTDADATFRRECAVIGLSFIGTAAPAEHEARARVVGLLRAAMASELDDVRFQACVAVVEVEGAAAEPELVAALAHEQHPMVRENLVCALSLLDPPGPAACEQLIAIVSDPHEGPAAIGFEAALALSAARRHEGGARLIEGLAIRPERDRALEALAVLGRHAPPAAAERVDRLARKWWLPAITRVRAAYALARLVARGTSGHPNPGIALLGRLAWHPRPAVREAVADARAALGELEG